MARLHNAFYLKQGGFSRDMRIKTAAACCNDIGWKRSIWRQVILLTELDGIGFYAIIGSRYIVDVGSSRDRSCMHWNLITRLERNECAISLKQLGITRPKIRATGIAGVITCGAWTPMKILWTGKLLSDETGTNDLCC